MHYTLTLLITLSCCAFTCNANTGETHHHHHGPTYSNTNYNLTNNDLQALIKADFNQTSQLQSITHTTQVMLGDARDKAYEYSQGAFSWVAHNKIKSIAIVGALSYGYVWYKLVSLNYSLSQTTLWSKWRETLSLEELLAKPQEEVATDLLTAIQRHYTTAEQIDDVIAPLIAFVHEVDVETAQLKQLIQLHAWIDRLRISFLFPKQAALVTSAQESINRLSYLKNILLTWVSKHKVARLTSVQTVVQS